MSSFFKKNKILLLVVLLFGGAGTVWFYRHYIYSDQSKNLTGIVDFQYDRDNAFIHDMFNKHWYWLVAEPRDESDFSPDYMMRYFSTENGPGTMGQLTIKMLYENGKPAGFFAYYMENFYLGKIRFVAVSEEFRSKGYGKKLTQYALDALRARGAVKVRLVTRSSNKAAQKVYIACGMHVAEEEGGYVFFEKVF